MDIYTDTLNSLNVWGVNVIRDVQRRYGIKHKFYNIFRPFLSSLEPHEQILFSVSHLADPGYAFSIMFPILSASNTLIAADVLMVSVMAEWCNAILKWILREDRPYWWVRETTLYGNSYPHLKQTPLTCETGPGCPSGHVMNAAALLYVIISSFINYYTKRNVNENVKSLIRCVFWCVYIFLLGLVSVSRMYMATHFPHQCMLGAILGFVIGRLFGKRGYYITDLWHNCKKIKMLIFVALLTSITVVMYFGQKIFGYDPQWSVKMAFKWCENPTYVHVSTTPMYTLVRDLGIGLGIVSVTPVMRKIPKSNKHNPMIGAACVLAYCMALHMAQSAVPTHDARLFYICHALLYSTMPFVLIGFLPNFASVKEKNN